MKSTTKTVKKLKSPGDLIAEAWAFAFSWCCSWRNADDKKLAGTGWKA